MSDPIALVCSVRLECAVLLGELTAARSVPAGAKPAWSGRLAGRRVRLVEAGVGKVNAAHALTALLERTRVSGVIGFGVAGAYRGSGLAPGEVALASASIYADEGVEAPGGWFGTDGIGIPLAEREGRRWFNEYPVPAEVLTAAEAGLREAGLSFRTGPFLTVSACSGTAMRGDALAARWGALCEGMEGAALAHVAAMYGLPCLEVRGVSNRVEDRDLSRWRIAEAAAAAQEAVRALVAADPFS